MSKRICVFGSSIARGSWDKEKLGWVNRLRLDIEDNIIREYSVYNLGVSGDTSSKVLMRIDFECSVRNPKIIIVSIGKNDLATSKKGGENWTNPQNYLNNLEQIVKAAQKYTDKIIFIGMAKVDESKTMPVSFGDKPHYSNDNVIKYNKKLKDFCETKKLLFIPLFDLLNDDEYVDGLHPNADGHEKIFQHVKKYLIDNKII